MSLLEPGSLDSTATVAPSGTDFTPRMSSSSGPGQNEPRASISLSIFGGEAATVIGVILSLECGSNEEGDLAFLGTLDKAGSASNLVDDVLKVLQLVSEQLHRGAASVNFH